MLSRSAQDLVETKEENKEKMAGHEETKTVRTQREEDIVVCHLSFYACHRMLGAYYFFPFFINLLLIQSGQFATDENCIVQKDESPDFILRGV